MRREPEHFEGVEVELLYVAKKLKEALAVEQALTERGIDYAVETDEYLGGVVFQSVRVGAFFYVAREAAAAARQALVACGYRPQPEP